MKAIVCVAVIGGMTACGHTATATSDESGWEGRWIVEWARPNGWRPHLFRGRLDLTHGETGWTPTVSFVEVAASTFTPTQVDIGEGFARLTFQGDEGARLHIELFRDGPTAHGGAWWTKEDGTTVIPWSVVEGAKRWDTWVVDGLEAPWPTATPFEVGLDAAQIDELVEEAQLTHSSGFVLVKDHQLVVAVGDAVTSRAHVASVSKALSSLAVPYLLAEGRWPSLDEPLGRAFEEWRSDPRSEWESDRRSEITLRQVLSHTTGLETPTYATWFEGAAKDHRKDVLSARLVWPPGSHEAYSNRAVELTSVLVQDRTGMALDDYLRPRLLDPIGVDAVWGHDPEGHARVHAGVHISALDLVKIGVLLADGGSAGGRQVLPIGWVDEATGRPAPGTDSRGLGWSLVEGRGFQHTGDSGAFLLVLPREGIVAARVHLSSRADEDERLPQHGIGGLLSGVLALRSTW